MSTDQEYWRSSTEDFKERYHLTPLHEALHAAVAQLLGGEVTKISIKKGGEGWAIYSAPPRPWQDIAVWLAPSLINDLSPGDETWLKRQNARRRGYAWSWIQKNKKRIMRRAGAIAKEIGGTPGTLKWDPEIEVWTWKARAKRRSISK